MTANGRGDGPAEPAGKRLGWKALALLLLAFCSLVVLWRTPAVWPFKIVLVLIHELGQRLAVVATGGQAGPIQILAGESSLSLGGGSRLLVWNAGYASCLLFGALVLLLAARTRLERWLMAALGGMSIWAVLAYVPSSNSFGFFGGLGTGAALLAAAIWLPRSVDTFLLELVGLGGCGYPIADVVAELLLGGQMRSDARMLADLFGLPMAFWSGLWIALAVAAAGFCLFLACRKPASADAG
ncbi:MAG: M50 family metallopeptidase [Deltaproteobacteria bacterium]|nr:M50 family metallopeptidase [Deltaproteobacteria bacterium]